MIEGSDPGPAQAQPRLATIIGRALRLRCPRCGEPGLVETWLRMARTCPACGFEPTKYDEGLVMGAYAFNLVAGEFVALATVLAIMLVTWPDAPWTLITVAGVVLSVALPFAFYPFSKLLFIGLNLLVRLSDPEPPPRR